MSKKQQPMYYPIPEQKSFFAKLVSFILKTLAVTFAVVILAINVGAGTDIFFREVFMRMGNINETIQDFSFENKMRDVLNENALNNLRGK